MRRGDAEFVSLRIGHDRPLESPLVLVLDPARAELLETLDLTGDGIIGFEIDVDPVLEFFALRDLGEHQKRMIGRLVRPADHREGLTRLAEYVEPERCRPEGRRCPGIVGIECDVLHEGCHEPTVAELTVRCARSDRQLAERIDLIGGPDHDEGDTVVETEIGHGIHDVGTG